MEIAISLAIIGFALVAIIAVLPWGMNAQRDNRERTVINQDATIFLQAISTGARGDDDLTNYVYAITNYQTSLPLPGTLTINGYAGSTLANGAQIIGLLSTPEFVDSSNEPVDYDDASADKGFSNHVVAYVHSISGTAVEKPPQTNDLVIGESLSYRIYCENLPVPYDTPPPWEANTYPVGAYVSYSSNGQTTNYWEANTATAAGDIPGASSKWTRVAYLQVLADNLRELRLTFLWPELPSGGVGNERQTYREQVAGQLLVNNGNPPLYIFQSQSFTNVP